MALEGHVAVATAADPSSAVPDVQDAPKEPGAFFIFVQNNITLRVCMVHVL